jgi:hypothetical protein
MTTPFYTTLTGPLQGSVDGSNYSLSNINNFYGSNIYARGGSGNSKVFDPTYNKAPTQTYGSFSSTATQTVSGAGTPTVITYNTTDVASGVSRGGTGQEGRVIVSETGIYKVLTSIIFKHSNSSASDCFFWVRKNGSDVANSGTAIAVLGEAIVGTVELILSLNANDYIEIYIASSDASTNALAYTASTSPYNRPACPSIITTIIKLSP